MEKARCARPPRVPIAPRADCARTGRTEGAAAPVPEPPLLRLATTALVVTGMAVILMPIVFVSWLAFFRNEVVAFPPGGYTLRWFGAIAGNKSFVDGFLLSLQVGLFAALVGLLVGVPASLALVRRRFAGRGAFGTLLLVPLVIPGIVAGAAIYIFQVETEIRTGLPIVASTWGLVLAHVLITIPWTVRLVGASLTGLDRSIEEAAINLGADPLTFFRRITLPLVRPGVVAAGLFGFIISFGNLEMTLFLVAPGQITLPIAILQYLEWRIDPTIAAVSFVQILIIATGMLVTDRYVKLARVL
jgi:putative spermidine/putrescine transport system permease protein